MQTVGYKECKIYANAPDNFIPRMANFFAKIITWICLIFFINTLPISLTFWSTSYVNNANFCIELRHKWREARLFYFRNNKKIISSFTWEVLLGSHSSVDTLFSYRQFIEANSVSLNIFYFSFFRHKWIKWIGMGVNFSQRHFT